MNQRTTKKALNAAFKRFQRLPEWPFNMLDSGRRSEDQQEQRSGAISVSPKKQSAEGQILPLAPGFLGSAQPELPAYSN
jgi:hypothetical protein